MQGLPENQIVGSILDAIAEQRLPAGTKLGEQALSDLFGCNRANVRRALATLAAQHVVELRPNRGAYVMTPSPKEARDVFQARRAIERTIAREAAGRATADDIGFLRRNIADEARAKASGDKPAELRASRDFHLRIAQIANNEVLDRFLSELTMRSTLILGLYSQHGSSSCAEDEHAQIVDALEQSDKEALVALTDRHLRHLEADLNFDARPRSPMTLEDRLSLSRDPAQAEQAARTMPRASAMDGRVRKSRKSSPFLYFEQWRKQGDGAKRLTLARPMTPSTGSLVRR